MESQPGSSEPAFFHPSEEAIWWLETTYELCEGTCTSRKEVYQDYQHFCNQRNRPSLHRSLFGKLIRKVFPGLDLHRLGPRNKSRYYYSPLRRKPKSEQIHNLHAQLSSPATQHNEIPLFGGRDAQDPGMDTGKLLTHLQRIYDGIVARDHSLIQHELTSFWDRISYGTILQESEYPRLLRQYVGVFIMARTNAISEMRNLASIDCTGIVNLCMQFEKDIILGTRAVPFNFAAELGTVLRNEFTIPIHQYLLQREQSVATV